MLAEVWGVYQLHWDSASWFSCNHQHFCFIKAYLGFISVSLHFYFNWADSWFCALSPDFLGKKLFTHKPINFFLLPIKVSKTSWKAIESVEKHGLPARWMAEMRTGLSDDEDKKTWKAWWTFACRDVWITGTAIKRGIMMECHFIAAKFCLCLSLKFLINFEYFFLQKLHPWFIENCEHDMMKQSINLLTNSKWNCA